MPSFVNIGAYVDQGTMVDTWATVGSCAQIGKHVHLSGGVGIGGVLEPLQAAPTIIEDDCFIGARSEVVEGVVVERGSVLGMGVYIGQSTRIYDRETGEIHYGRVPAGSVVVAGNLPSKDGKYSLYCAVIVKKVDEKTRSKTSLNELLRTGGLNARRRRAVIAGALRRAATSAGTSLVRFIGRPSCVTTPPCRVFMRSPDPSSGSRPPNGPLESRVLPVPRRHRPGRVGTFLAIGLSVALFRRITARIGECHDLLVAQAVELRVVVVDRELALVAFGVQRALNPDVHQRVREHLLALGR